ncbi:hypothetical protein ACO0LB_19345 [Undibacterium sp. SXout7W]
MYCSMLRDMLRYMAIAPLVFIPVAGLLLSLLFDYSLLHYLQMTYRSSAQHRMFPILALLSRGKDIRQMLSPLMLQLVTVQTRARLKHEIFSRNQEQIACNTRYWRSV